MIFWVEILSHGRCLVSDQTLIYVKANCFFFYYMHYAHVLGHMDYYLIADEAHDMLFLFGLEDITQNRKKDL